MNTASVQDFGVDSGAMKWWVYAGFGLSLGACAAPAARVEAPPSRPVLVQHSAPKPAFAARGTFDASGPADSVTAWLRVTNPARDLPVFGQLTGVGAVLDPTEILKHRLGPALGSVVNQELPLDIALHKTDDPEVVFSCGVDGVESFIERTRGAYDVVQVADGRWKLAPKDSPDPSWLGCELWQAAPPVNARLLCSDHPRAITAQAPFLMSADRKVNAGIGLRLEFPQQALKSFLEEGAKKADHDANDDTAGGNLGKSTVVQLTGELSGLIYDVTLGNSSVEVRQELDFSKTEGLLSLLLSGHAAPHAAVPEAFWRLPAASDIALYWEGADPRPLRSAWSALVMQLVAIEDSQFETPPAYRADLQRVFESLAGRGGAGVVTYGQDREQAEKALEIALKPASPGALHAQLMGMNEKLQGWLLVGLEDDPEPYIGALRDLAKLAKVKTPRRKKSAPEAGSANLPKPEPPSETTSRFAEVPLKLAHALPKGSAEFLLEVRPNPKYVAKPGSKQEPPLPTTWHLLAVPEGKYVWLSVARDEAEALARVRALLTGGATGTLADDAELRREASAPVSGIGYASIAGIMGLSLKATSSEQVMRSLKHLSTLWSLPARGATPIHFILENDGGNGVGRRVSLSVRLTPAVIADLLQLIVGAGLEAH